MSTEKTRLRNLINQQKARLFTRLFRASSNAMIAEFRERSLILFQIFARSLRHESVSLTTRQDILAKIDAKFNRQEAKGVPEIDVAAPSTDRPQAASSLLENEETTIAFFKSLVWSKNYQKMGRPAKSTQLYMQDSEARIADWEAEIASIALSKTEHSKEIEKLKNKIAALRGRMRLKSAVQQDDQLALSASQVNLKDLTKVLLSSCREQKMIKRRLSIEIDKEMSRDRQEGCQGRRTKAGSKKSAKGK